MQNYSSWWLEIWCQDNSCVCVCQIWNCSKFETNKSTQDINPSPFASQNDNDLQRVILGNTPLTNLRGWWETRTKKPKTFRSKCRSTEAELEEGGVCCFFLLSFSIIWWKLKKFSNLCWHGTCQSVTIFHDDPIFYNIVLFSPFRA